MNETRIVEYIQTFEHRGIGTEADPHRYVHQLWTKGGQLVAEYDPWCKEKTFFHPHLGKEKPA